MYAAYQSHQSCGGATASNEPWRSDVSCRSSASAATSMVMRTSVGCVTSASRLRAPLAPVESLVLRGARLSVPVVLDAVVVAEQPPLAIGDVDQDRALVGIEGAHRA